MLVETDTGERAYVRFTNRDGRLEATEMYLPPGDLTPDSLRRLPLGRVEAWANDQRTADAIRARLDVPGPDLVDVIGDFARTRGPSRRQWTRSRLSRSAFAGKSPDAFYRRVAEAYADLSAKSGRPAVEIAEIAGVPISTAHRWIKEARRRGHLPPGRRGKAG